MTIDASAVAVRYPDTQRDVIDNVTFCIPKGRVTALIGPNGSGKSTLLKAIGKQLGLREGRIRIDDKDVSTFSRHEMAMALGMLWQENGPLADMTVRELVEMGRYPHRRLFSSLSAQDHSAIQHAIDMVDMGGFQQRPMASLSGGQKQLAWIAMVLAQETSALLLDEPTTYLDLQHQQIVMGIVARLSIEKQLTVVLAVHDINHAIRCSDNLIVLREGRVLAHGDPASLVTPELMLEAFGVEVAVVAHPVTDRPICVLV